MATQPKLRERQAKVARDAILDAVIAKLQDASDSDFSMQDIAEAAGVSLRTLYRYFPSRGETLTAAGARIRELLDLPQELSGPDDVVPSFLEASAKMAQHLELARALVATPAGRDTRSSMLRRRRARIERAMHKTIADLDPGNARQAMAVLMFLCDATSWMTLSNDYGLSIAEARGAIAWALNQLLDSIRRGDVPLVANSGVTPAASIAPDPGIEST